MMPDLTIITIPYRGTASINPESSRGKQWLAEHVIVDPYLLTFRTTIEGAQEIEQLARQDDLSVETR